MRPGHPVEVPRPLRRLGPSSVAVALALALSSNLGAETSDAAQAGRNVLDRTVSCAIAGVGSPDPARYISVFAFPKRPNAAPLVFASHGEGDGGMSVGLSAGAAMQAWINVSQCRPVPTRIALTASSLAGGRTTFGEQQRCEVPARVLIRVQAIFVRPFALRTDPDRRYQQVARGRISSGSLAVATPKGKPIAFARTDAATGRASIFASRTLCFPS